MDAAAAQSISHITARPRVEKHLDDVHGRPCPVIGYT
jgi:hypothetical protein